MPFLAVNGTNLYFSLKGTGVPIVLIHPPVLTSTSFKYQIEELSRKFQIISFDIRGHGRSEFSNEPITYPLIVNDIKQLLNHLKIKQAYICGYSAGASIALEFLLTAKEQALGGIVISGMSEISDRKQKKRISLAIKMAKARAVPVLATSICWSNSDTKPLFLKMFLDSLKSNAKNIEQYYDDCLNYNCTNQLSDIHVPVILIYGKQDEPFNKYAQILHEKLPDNKLKFIDHVDHQVPTQAAKELNKIITEFIEKEETAHNH